MTDRVALSGTDAETYFRMVGQHLPDHPFLQNGTLANDVLASIVLASALCRDLMPPGDLAPFQAQSRQPFLWRAVQSITLADPHRALDGRYVGCVLNSMWNDPFANAYRTTVAQDPILPSQAVIRMEQPGGRWEFVATYPIEFYEQIRSTSCTVPGSVVLQGHRRQEESASFEIRGETVLRSRAVDVRANAVRIDGDVRISTEDLDQPPNVRLSLAVGARIWWGGAMTTTHPWNQHQATLSPLDDAPPTKLEILLERLAHSLPRGAPLTVMRGSLRLTDDHRILWIKREYDTEKFAEMLRILIGAGLARTEPSGVSGPDPLEKVRFDLGWAEILDAVRDPESADVRLRQVVDSLKVLLA